MQILTDLQKLKIKYQKRIGVLEERKGYATGKNFDKILDEIYSLNTSIDKISRVEDWLKLEQSGKYKIVAKFL